MFARCRTILFAVCIFVTLIQIEADAKPFLEIFYDSLKFQHNSYHKPHRHHAVAPAAPEPVGGKERFKQICNVIRGISDCYAWQMTHWNHNIEDEKEEATSPRNHTYISPWAVCRLSNSKTLIYSTECQFCVILEKLKWNRIDSMSKNEWKGKQTEKINKY